MSLEAYADALTEAFQGYRRGGAQEAEALARRVRFEQHDLVNSLLAYDGGWLAGVAALAVRGDAGRVAGFAIVPHSRGRGRGRELFAALVGRARASGLRRLSLEVSAGNEPARRLYERAGMRRTRDLLIMERADGGRGDSTLKEADADALLRHFWRLHAVRPAWQRDLPALLAASLRGFYLGESARPSAYALLGRGLDGNTYVSDLAAAGRGAARSLAAGLGGALKVVNEPEESLFVEPLLAAGFFASERQHEMHMSL